MPNPTAAERSQPIAVSALDHLFTDPYFIYARYVLNLRESDAWDAFPEARDFGSIAHGCIEKLMYHWNEYHRAATSEELAVLVEAALRQFSDRPNVRLFWHRRLLRALAFVNTQEAARRDQATSVRSEVTVEAALPLGEGTLHLRGRVDRLESRSDRPVVIGDYKTGAAPVENDLVKGKAVQLLAYALMMEVDAAGIAYWSLPSAKREGRITDFPADRIAEHGLLEKLRAALADFMDPATPLLARAVTTSGRFENPYDGISRYDEWTG